MTWITAKLLGVRNIDDANNVRAPRRPTLKIVGATIEDDEANDRTILTFTGVGLVAEVTAQAPLVVVPNPDAAHPQLQITNATTSARGTMSAADKTKLDSIDATAAFLVDAVSTTLANGRALRALAEEIPVEGAAGVTPWSFAHKAAAGSVGRAFRVRRTLTSGVGSSGTGVDVGWYLPDGFGDETLVATDRVEATSVLGVSVAAKRVFALGGTDRLTIKSTGLLQAHGYTTGIAHFDADGDISSSLIVDADVDEAAAIQCTKTDGDFVDTPVLSDGGFEPSTAGGALAVGATAGDVSIGQTGVSTVSIQGDLVVNGSTITANSTTIDLADRVVHVNASALGEGAVPAPTQIAGVAVDRGTADGTTKRDMPVLAWQESSSRWLAAYCTAGDDATVGAGVPVACSGVQAVAAAAFKVGDSTVTTSVETDSTTGTVNFRIAGSSYGSVSQTSSFLRVINHPTNSAAGVNIASIAGVVQLASASKVVISAVDEVEFQDSGTARVSLKMASAAGVGLENTASGGRVGLTAEHLVFNAAAIGKVNTVSFSATPTFDLRNAAIQRMTLTGNVTSSTFSDGVNDAEYEVQLLQDGTGGHTFAWPGSAKFPDNLGANPDVPGATANTMTVWRFRRYATAMMCTCVAKNIPLP